MIKTYTIYKGGINMGFYYLLLLLIGVILIVVGALWRGVSPSIKIVMMLFIVGIHFIIISIVLLMPGSSDILAELLKLDI